MMTQMTCPYGITTVGYRGDARGLCYTESEAEFTKILIACILGGVIALVVFFYLIMRARGYRCVKQGNGKWTLAKPDKREFYEENNPASE